MTTAKGVILFGHPRSGTTLLRRLLAGNPEIAAPPETFVFDAAARFLHADRSAEGTDVGVLAGLSFLGFDDEETLSRLRNLCFGFLDEYAEREGKRVWVEKTAFQAFRIAEIVRLCGDDVRYIGILRHPFDVASSTIEFCARMGAYPEVLHKYVQRYEQPLEAFLMSWRDVTDALLTLGQTRTDNCMLIRYEDLVEFTEETVSGLLDFIGVKSDAGFLDRALEEPGTPGFSDHKAYRSRRVEKDLVGRWHNLPKAQVAGLAPLVAKEMKLLGYDPIESDSGGDDRQRRRAYLHGLEFGSDRE